MSMCEDLVEGASAGVAPALRAVDCMAGETTAMAFNRLFGAEGALMPALTIILTLYIAFFALSLLAGRSRLSIPALTPKMLTLGLVLTFATSWMAYSQVVWNLAVGAPDQLASLLIGADGSATQIFADRIDIVLAAIGEISQAAGQGLDQAAAAQGAATGTFTPANLMWLAALLLLLGTVGILVTARIALAVLLALGPVFVVFALFSGTRGLTAGWLRGVVMTGLAPLFVVTSGSFTLELMVPVLNALGGIQGIDPRAAMALFLIASVHVALMAMVLKVSQSMVSGWQVFGLAARDNDAKSAAASGSSIAAAQPVAAPAQNSSPRRMATIAAAGAGSEMASGSASGSGASHSRRTVTTTQVTNAPSSSLPPLARQRARGIGSRFRAPSPQPRQMAR